MLPLPSELKDNPFYDSCTVCYFDFLVLLLFLRHLGKLTFSVLTDFLLMCQNLYQCICCELQSYSYRRQ